LDVYYVYILILNREFILLNMISTMSGVIIAVILVVVIVGAYFIIQKKKAAASAGKKGGKGAKTGKAAGGKQAAQSKSQGSKGGAVAAGGGGGIGSKAGAIGSTLWSITPPGAILGAAGVDTSGVFSSIGNALSFGL
jgi:hypothetical protein